MADIEIKISGTKATLKVTPKFPLESVRPLNNGNGKKGTSNKPHFHINIFKLWQRITKGNQHGNN